MTTNHYHVLYLNEEFIVYIICMLLLYRIPISSTFVFVVGVVSLLDVIDFGDIEWIRFKLYARRFKLNSQSPILLGTVFHARHCRQPPSLLWGLMT